MLAMGRRYNYTMPHITGYKTVLSQECLLDFETTINIYAFKGNAFVTVYTDDYVTPVCWDTRVKDFRGYASEPHSNIILCFSRRNMCSLSLFQCQGTRCSKLAAKHWKTYFHFYTFYRLSSLGTFSR
jgi:hypothetical protein